MELERIFFSRLANVGGFDIDRYAVRLIELTCRGKSLHLATFTRILSEGMLEKDLVSKWSSHLLSTIVNRDMRSSPFRRQLITRWDRRSLFMMQSINTTQMA
jgi:hypothetical protein